MQTITKRAQASGPPTSKHFRCTQSPHAKKTSIIPRVYFHSLACCNQLAAADRSFSALCSYRRWERETATRLGQSSNPRTKLVEQPPPPPPPPGGAGTHIAACYSTVLVLVKAADLIVWSRSDTSVRVCHYKQEIFFLRISCIACSASLW